MMSELFELSTSIAAGLTLDLGPRAKWDIAMGLELHGDCIFCIAKHCQNCGCTIKNVALEIDSKPVILSYYSFGFGRLMYPSVPLPHCINPTQGTTFHRNEYVALKFLKLPVMSVKRYFCDAEYS